jgi:hypothetical protein
MTDDGYGWNEYSPFKTPSGEDKSIYLSIPFIHIMNIIYKVLTENNDRDCREVFYGYENEIAWIEDYCEFHTGIRIDLVQDFPLELLSLIYRRCFVNRNFEYAISMIADHRMRYHLFTKYDWIRELSNDRLLKNRSLQIQGEAGGEIDRRSFGFLPMYLFLKFLSYPATEPIKIFRDEKFSFFENHERKKMYMIGHDDYGDEIGNIRLGEGSWRFTSRIFSDELPIPGGFSTTPVPNLIHESIQSKIKVGALKRIPMNYFRRGIFFES